MRLCASLRIRGEISESLDGDRSPLVVMAGVGPMSVKLGERQLSSSRRPSAQGIGGTRFCLSVMEGLVPAIRASTVGAKMDGTAPGHDGEREKSNPTHVLSNLSTDTSVAAGTKSRRPAMTNRADRASIEAVISERILTAGAAIGLGVPFWKGAKGREAGG